MVKYDVKKYVTAIIVTFILGFFLACLFKPLFKQAGVDCINCFSFGVSFAVLCAFCFVSFAWKWRIFYNWLVPFPCLKGTWNGKIEYKEVDSIKKKTIKVEIEQTFFHIIVKMKSNESVSRNYCGCFDIDKDKGINSLIYSYLNEPAPEYRKKSPIHHGTTKLDIEKGNKKLVGVYWTDRGTTGKIWLNKKC